MAIFAISAPSSNMKIGPAIAGLFPNDHLQAWQGQWFVSASGTAHEIAMKLNVAEGAVGTVIVLSVSNYWGRANPEVWEWLKSKLEKK
jgi:hypothetical protein